MLLRSDVGFKISRRSKSCMIQVMVSRRFSVFTFIPLFSRFKNLPYYFGSLRVRRHGVIFAFRIRCISRSILPSSFSISIPRNVSRVSFHKCVSTFQGHIISATSRQVPGDHMSLVRRPLQFPTKWLIDMLHHTY